MLNTHNVSYVQSENALLSLMSIMFNIQNKSDVQEFKLRQFASCYRLFFTSTLMYESLSMTTRMKAFETLNKVNPEYSWLNAFTVGAAV
jgi:hypothetical protein